MDCYSIIKDETSLRSFIHYFLPDLQDDEKFLVCLFSRKKYADDPTQCPSESLLKRFVSTKEYLVEKIRQLEIKQGCYTNKGKPLPEESLCLYINPNPRCLVKARYKLMHRLVESLEKQHQNFNPHSEALSCIHRAKSYTAYVDFDIDDKNVDITEMNKVFPVGLKGIVYSVLETRGGYHILVDPNCVNIHTANYALPKDWYKRITQLFPIDQKGDELMPVPGCIQGDFVPRFI